MKTLSVLFISTVFSIISFAQNAPRPQITGIDHVSFYTTNPDGVKKLYTGTLGLASATPIEAGDTSRYMSRREWRGYGPAVERKLTDAMESVSFTTDDIAA